MPMRKRYVQISSLKAGPPGLSSSCLDGTAKLRVSRFLHLDLDIELREPADAVPQQETVQPGADTPRPMAYAVYAIRQSRQVQIQDLHYFDGPVIAVLAVVSRVEPLAEAVQ